MSNRFRKYQLTFNNPEEHGVNHEKIRNIMQEFNCLYYCMADEIGEQEQTPHTHLYFCCENAVYFDTVKKRFPSAHIESVKGTSTDNRDYILKQGKHADKSITSIPGSFEEFGELPDDTKSKNETVAADVLEMLENGCSNKEIISAHPSYLTKTNSLDNARNTIKKDKYKNEFRKIEVIFIFGKSQSGKTSYVLKTYGNENVYRVTDYKHPFDDYNFEDVIFFDDYDGDLTINELIKYLDEFPCSLPARYGNKQACYTKVFFASSFSLDNLYKNISFEKWNAFINRIDKILEFVIENNELIINEFNPCDYIR